MINKYQDRYNRLLETTNVSGEDLNKNLQKQINYYNKLIANSQKVIKSRKAETASLENKKITYTYTYQKDSGSNAKGDQKLKQSKYKLSHYVKYDDKNNIVSINNKSLIIQELLVSVLNFIVNLLLVIVITFSNEVQSVLVKSSICENRSSSLENSIIFTTLLIFPILFYSFLCLVLLFI